MKYLICSDIDGTLLNKKRELSTKTISQFNRLKNRYPLILISSRMPKSMRQLQKSLGILDHPIIAYNGNLILDGARTISQHQIPISLVELICEYIKGTQVHLSLYHHDQWVVPQDDYWTKRERKNTRVKPHIEALHKTLYAWEKKQWGAHKIMCMGKENEIEILYNQLIHHHSHELHCYRSKPTYIEISTISIDKASAIELLLQYKYPELSMKNVIAFGDNYNDISLLRHAGIGVAVENAKPEVSAVSDFQTMANVDDGVAVYLEKFITS